MCERGLRLVLFIFNLFRDLSFHVCQALKMHVQTMQKGVKVSPECSNFTEGKVEMRKIKQRKKNKDTNLLL